MRTRNAVGAGGRWIVAAAGGLLSLAGVASAEDPLYAQTNAARAAVPLLEQIKAHVPPLKHERGTRWPMILWEGVSFEPQSNDVYRAMLARGLTQHIRLDDKMIPTAKALQDAGSPVIMMQGAGGSWPYELAGGRERWAHQYDEGYKPTGDAYGQSCLGVLTGWQVGADQVRATLRKYKEAGVTVNAVWMDWEGEPLGSWYGYENARHCRRCRETLPRQVLATERSFKPYCARLYIELTGTYLAAPVREIFPSCSVANWMVVASTHERPVRHWNDRVLPPFIPSMFTAMNPVAYGDTTYFRQCWKPEYKLDREHVDAFYAHLLLRQVTDSEANCQLYEPQVDSVPWVIRWCPDDEDPKIPIMTRERYREVLRHLWLRGVDAMQVFNASRKGYEDIVIGEVEDAVSVYDEMLAYREYLDEGEVMCLDMPGPQDEGVLWSGLRRGNSAVVRAFKQGGGKAEFEIAPWPEKKVTLKATSEGRTYVLTLDGDKVKVK